MEYKLFRKISILIALIISGTFYVNYGAKSATFYGDALGYYIYLPATFIYHNLTDLKKPPDRDDIDKAALVHISHVPITIPGGNAIVQYTYGIAFMELPFFLAAHCYEKTLGGHPNGYSDTYRIMLKVADLFYAIAGLLLIYAVLKRYFTPLHSFLGTCAVFFGTNLFWFSLYQAGMAHVPLFFLYAALMYTTIKLHERPVRRLFILAGIIAGLITIIRPTDIVCLLIPLLYNAYDRETINEKIAFLKANYRNILFFSAAFIMPAIPQLCYWHAITGHIIYYSYGQQSFYWLHPKIIEGLFYYNNGWLPYSLIMIFAIVGLCLYRSIKQWSWVIWMLFPVYVYIIYSWYCYTYINGFGSRPMIHIYPLLAIPLTAFIVLISRQRLAIKILFCSICTFFIAVNLCYSIQQAKGVLYSQESNIVFNLQMLFRIHLTYNDLVVNDLAQTQPDEKKLVKIATLASNDFEDSTSDHFVRNIAPGHHYMYSTLTDEYAPSLAVQYSKQTFKDARWVKCSGKFMYPYPPGYFQHLLVFNIRKNEHEDKALLICKIENKISWENNNETATLKSYATNTWGYVSFYTKVPGDLCETDIIRLYLWNIDRNDIYISDLRLELYK